MGPASHNKVSPRIDSGTLTDKANTRDNVLIGRAGKISEEIEKLLSKGAIVEVTISKKTFVSKIFLVEKKEGG